MFISEMNILGMYFYGTQVLLFKRRYNEGLIEFSNQ